MAKRPGQPGGTPQQWRMYATCPPGAGPLLDWEMRDLGFNYLRCGFGGVSFQGDRDAMMRATLALRTAHRILWVLGEVDARDADWLYESVKRLVRWHGLIPVEKTFAVFATAQDSAFRDSRYVGLRVKDAIVDAVRDETGDRPNVDVADPDIVVRVQVNGTRGRVSLDAAGRHSLHARGYREETGTAPLRESLAAAMIMASHWDGQQPLVDPMCGSGTLLIEAASMARGELPSRLSLGFERWQGHRPKRMEAVADGLRATLLARVAETEPRLFGFDTQRRVLEDAQTNAAVAEVNDLITWGRQSVEALENPCPGEVGVLVANPPYGERLGEIQESIKLCGVLGDRLRAEFPGWAACIMLPSREHLDAMDLPIEARWQMKNGPIDVQVIRMRVPD
ncbi:MAG: 23S rRNA (guanine2445-N2)-methyltransferase / 23S rRNA (guanine2069-N7)-methyltransferase [Myxococcota bacterium]|jgi:23S rRNA (guanine2445-N2)-methyltransferase / 23S rRNA (guanine2069-N7)-methyltransferase